MRVEYLNDADDTDIKRHSSINQYGAFLSVKKGGVNVPLRFDSLDWINCDGIKTHPVIVSDGNDLGYHFPVGHYTYFTDNYLIVDRKEVVVKKLPKWYGEGWYEKMVQEKDFVNFDNGSLGSRDRVDLRTGLDYIVSDDVLDDSDEE